MDQILYPVVVMLIIITSTSQVALYTLVLGQVRQMQRQYLYWKCNTMHDPVKIQIENVYKLLLSRVLLLGQSGSSINLSHVTVVTVSLTIYM